MYFGCYVHYARENLSVENPTSLVHCEQSMVSDLGAVTGCITASLKRFRQEAIVKIDCRMGCVSRRVLSLDGGAAAAAFDTGSPVLRSFGRRQELLDLVVG